LSDHAASNRTLNLTHRRDGDASVLTVAGEVDIATAPQLRSAIDEILDDGAGALWIDLCRTTFMDSSGLQVLFASHARTEKSGRRLAIVCPPGPVRRLLEITGSAQRLPLFDDLAA
jgi:anti-sigma B factor antagonist